MAGCYFDKQGIFHHCEIRDDNIDCIGCWYEKRIAKTWVMLCHYCGSEIVANRIKAFCNKDCRNDWLSDRRSFDNSGECLFWTEGDGPCPIYDTEELREAQYAMLGYPRVRIGDYKKQHGNFV